MRLIDADLVVSKLQAVLDGKANEKESTAYFAFRAFIDLIDTEPTIDPATLAPKWISVEERLPEPDVDVLARCYYHERWQTFVCHLNKKLPRGWFTSVAGQWVQVTHWLPLPAPAEDEENL